MTDLHKSKEDQPLTLPWRCERPRSWGLTAVMDTGLPLGELDHILSDYHSYIDFAKFGIGSGYITPRLREKLALYKSYDIPTCFGGTLFEKFYRQDKLDAYMSFVDGLGVEWIEISNGTLPASHDEMLAAVEKVSSDFNVVAEVGSKDVDVIMPPSQWLHDIRSFLDAGCRYVIMEGRDSASAGIYRQTGEIRTGLVADILSNIDHKKLIFEAPTSDSQIYFIRLVGPNVNLGNVSLRDILLLECQRVGLRSDTFFTDAESDRPDKE